MREETLMFPLSRNVPNYSSIGDRALFLNLLRVFTQRSSRVGVLEHPEAFSKAFKTIHLNPVSERRFDCNAWYVEISYMSKSFLKVALPIALIAGGMMVSTQFSFGKAEYAKNEGKGCTYCHTAAGKKDLNDVGKCYAEHNHSLEGCGK
jgi:hypothetical protein